MRLRITHVITKLDVGGAQTHVVELASGQARSGHAVEVVTGVGGPAAERLGAAAIPVHVIPELGGSYGRLSQRGAVSAVTAQLTERPPDIVHGHSSNAGLAARLAARRLGVPSVYTAHGWPFQKGAAWPQRMLSFAGEFVGGHLGDAVIVLTRAEYERAVRARVVPRDRLWIIPNGITDVPASLVREPSRGTRPVELVMVARFAPPKLQAELLHALTEIADLQWALTFVGDGPGQRHCVELAARLGLADRVQFLGHRDDVAAILAASDIGVLWSRYEGLPISVIEYLRAGLCCLCSDLPGTRELLGQPPVGVFGGTATDVRAVLTDPSGIDRLGAAARQRYLEAYSATAMVATTDRTYASVLAGR